MYNSFWGWYFKCQCDKQTLAVIPAVHRKGVKRTCSIQIITDKNVWNIPFSGKAFHRTRNEVRIGKNRFGKGGLILDIHRPGLTIQGKLRFVALTPIKYDIMGPFAFVPFMECRHSVRSMGHSVDGSVSINGQKYSFRHGSGYWEGDRGRSFPERYIWTQCSFDEGSLMLSVADIPISGIHFTGIIGIVLWKGKEYRLATYLGARAVEIHDGIVRIAQRNLELECRLLEEAGYPLKAPQKGEMVRTIHESAACRAAYIFRMAGKTILEFETDQASFEYEYF